MLLVDHQEGKILYWSKNRRARPDNDVGIAAMNAVPLFCPLVICQAGMQNCNLLSENTMQVGGRGGRESYFGNQKNRGASLGKHGLHGRKVDCGFTRSRNSMQQRHREASLVYAGFNRLQCLSLRGIQVLSSKVR